MRLRSTLLFLVAATSACAQPIDLEPHDDQYELCGRRAGSTSPPAGARTVVGKIRQLDDSTPVDGPVNIVLVDPHGDLRKLHFGSLYTRPSTSEARRATYRSIASSKLGDCVRATGSVMANGKLWVDDFQNFDRPHARRGDERP
jgi:hypothetical protein